MGLLGQRHRHVPFTFIALNGRSMHARRALSGNAGDRMIIYILMLKLLQLSSADSRCEHDSISIVQYTEAITALEYDEAQANGQGAVISQAVPRNPGPLTIEWDFSSLPATTPGYIRTYLEYTVAPAISTIIASYFRVKYTGQSVGMNPCGTYYPTPNAHSQANPYRCASIKQTPTCGGSTINPKHLLYYKLCSSYWSCGEVSGKAGSSSSLVMYMQYNPSSASCRTTTVAYAAYCSKGDLGRPTVAYMNWCNKAQLTATEALLGKHLEVGVHEVLHAMGFSGGMWRQQHIHKELSYFLKPDGSGFQRFADVVAQQSIRNGMGTFIISPTAVREARRHSGCMTLPGVQLEASGGSGTAGSHVEDYLYYGDVMCGWVYSTGGSSAPTEYGQAVLSPITLAILEDTGYYLVNWDQAGQLSWGYDAGCDFAMRTCADFMQQHPDQPWFLGASGAGCTRDRLQISEVASSGLGCYSKHRGYSKAHRCATEGTTAPRGEFGEAVGQGARCLEHSRSVKRNISGVSYASESRTIAGCYTMLCKTDGTMSILIDGSEEVPCPANTTLMLPESLGYQASDEHRGSVDCPDAAAVCAADVDTLGQVTCGTQADCRERGVCTGGRCRCMLLHSGCNCGALRYEKGATDGDCTASASRPAEAGGGRPQGSSGGGTVPLPPPPTAQPLTPPPPPPLSSITPGRAVPPQPPVVEPEPSGGSAAEFKNVVSGWSRCRSRAGPDCVMAGVAVQGERYQTVRCQNTRTGLFVDLTKCELRQSLQYESCAVPECSIKAGTLRITAGAWSKCSSPCTRSTDASPPRQTRTLTCELIEGEVLVFDPAGLTGASVSAEVFERDCGHSVSSSAATQRPCNGQLCEEGWWAVGGWGKCLAQCGAVGPGAGAAWGMQQRSVQCTQQPCAEVEPSASRRCSVLCDACTRRPCGNRGECESVLVSGAAAPRCVCAGAYGGDFCSYEPQCDGTMFTSATGVTACCPVGQFVTTAGTCCSQGSTLDVSGACCAEGAVDGCGVCSGRGVGFDRFGQCCMGYLTEDLLCCPEPLDWCGACGDGSSCNPELVLRLGGISEAVYGSIMNTTRCLLCAHFGFAYPNTCPLTISAGSGVLPASRQLRHRAMQHAVAEAADGHAMNAGLRLQAADVGLQVLRAWAEAWGAIAVASAAAAPPALWAHPERPVGRGLLDTDTGSADVLELSIEFDLATAQTLNASQGVKLVSLGDMQQAIESVATQLQEDTGAGFLKSSVGIATICGNRVCETGELDSCPSDCVVLRSCPEPEEGVVAANSGQCSGRGACNFLQGVCNCIVGYTGHTCDMCDSAGGYFWEERSSYCRKTPEAGRVVSRGEPDVYRSSSFGKLEMVAVLCTGVAVLLSGAALLWARYKRQVARRQAPAFDSLVQHQFQPSAGMETADATSPEVVSIY